MSLSSVLRSCVVPVPGCSSHLHITTHPIHTTSAHTINLKLSAHCDALLIDVASSCASAALDFSSVLRSCCPLYPGCSSSHLYNHTPHTHHVSSTHNQFKLSAHWVSVIARLMYSSCASSSLEPVQSFDPAKAYPCTLGALHICITTHPIHTPRQYHNHLKLERPLACTADVRSCASAAQMSLSSVLRSCCPLYLVFTSA
jgi:hypothetical protein